MTDLQTTFPILNSFRWTEGKNENQRLYVFQFEIFSLTQIYLQIKNEKLYVHL